MPRPVMVNKLSSQAEESQLVESLPAGNSIELISANLSRSTNSVFSRLHHLGLISIDSSKAIDINYRDAVFNFKEENIDIDLNTRCIDWAELVGPKRLKKNPNFYRCESCQLTFESSGKVYRVFAVTSMEDSVCFQIFYSGCWCRRQFDHLCQMPTAHPWAGNSFIHAGLRPSPLVSHSRQQVNLTSAVTNPVNGCNRPREYTSCLASKSIYI